MVKSGGKLLLRVNLLQAFLGASSNDVSYWWCRGFFWASELSLSKTTGHYDKVREIPLKFFVKKWERESPPALLFLAKREGIAPSPLPVAKLTPLSRVVGATNFYQPCCWSYWCFWLMLPPTCPRWIDANLWSYAAPKGSCTLGRPLSGHPCLCLYL